VSQQGLRQASARTLSGFATGSNYNEDLLRLFDSEAVPAGTFNERQLMFINARLGRAFLNINEAMQAFATASGATNWSSLGALTAGTITNVRITSAGDTRVTSDGSTRITTG